MHSLTSLSTPVRLLIRACSGVVLLLLWASVSYAAHAPHRASRRVCDPQRATIRQLPRKPVSYGGPLAKPSLRVLAGLSDPMTRMARVTHQTLSADDEAIQNDIPAAHPVVDRVPELQPLGLFADVFDQRPRTRTFSPRAPRGPPISA